MRPLQLMLSCWADEDCYQLYSVKFMFRRLRLHQSNKKPVGWMVSGWMLGGVWGGLINVSSTFSGSNEGEVTETQAG